MSDLLDLISPGVAITSTPPVKLACPCGSGLSEPGCCGLDLRRTETVHALGPHAAEIAALLRAYRTGDRDTARRLALDVLGRSPGQREALGALFTLLQDEQAWTAAGKIADRLALLHPNDPMPRLVAAQFFLTRAENPRAFPHARMLVRLAPEVVVSHVTMGRVFLASNNGAAAEHHFRVALRLPASDLEGADAVEIEANLAVALRDQGRLDEARAIFARLTEVHGPRARLLLSWAKLEESARRFDIAADLLDRAAILLPGNRQIAIARIGLYRRLEQPDKALEALSVLDEQDGQDVGDGFLQRGQILDSMGRYDEAFIAFDAFKARLRERTGQDYQAEQAERLVTALTGFFTPGRDPLLPRAETRTDSAQPIFIVGFPRSGTTLVEQTLTSHPQIAAGDELQIINMIVDRSPLLLGSPGQYPVALSELWIGDRIGHINTLRDLYLNEAMRIGAIDPAKRWFTDKMPLNETHLGLISLLFPQSPVVHLVRHPLDVVLSVFSNGLTHGFHCANALETAARHYALIAELIAHYRSVMAIRYHAVRYEDLVVDQEREVRALFAFIGEPFDPRTLDFHTNVRPARTASHAQVTEKL